MLFSAHDCGDERWFVVCDGADRSATDVSESGDEITTTKKKKGRSCFFINTINDENSKKATDTISTLDSPSQAALVRVWHCCNFLFLIVLNVINWRSLRVRRRARTASKWTRRRRDTTRRHWKTVMSLTLSIFSYSFRDGWFRLSRHANRWWVASQSLKLYGFCFYLCFSKTVVDSSVGLPRAIRTGDVCRRRSASALSERSNTIIVSLSLFQNQFFLRLLADASVDEFARHHARLRHLSLCQRTISAKTLFSFCVDHGRDDSVAHCTCAICSQCRQAPHSDGCRRTRHRSSTSPYGTMMMDDWWLMMLTVLVRSFELKTFIS